MGFVTIFHCLSLFPSTFSKSKYIHPKKLIWNLRMMVAESNVLTVGFLKGVFKGRGGLAGEP